jgi:hypothetical protein
MSKRSIFFDYWQDCLRAHYVHVLSTDDKITEPTLRHVLLQTGLSEEDLCDLKAMAGVDCDEDLDAEPIEAMELYVQPGAAPIDEAALPAEVYEDTPPDQPVAPASELDEIEYDETELDQSIAPASADEPSEVEYDETELDQPDDEDAPEPPPDTRQLSLF